MKKIDKFTGDYEFLSNFFPCNLQYRYVIYESVEHAYQAAKCVKLDDWYKIKDSPTCAECKKIGRKIKIRKDWDKVKDDIMYDLVFSKFSQNRLLKTKLVDTYPAKLVEGNWWGDTYWGKCKGKGKNKLGKILMHIRDALG